MYCILLYILITINLTVNNLTRKLNTNNFQVLILKFLKDTFKQGWGIISSGLTKEH